jgi:gliding motility-associated-like protein
MRNHLTAQSIWIASIALFCAFSVQGQYTQLPECTAEVPFFELDLSANPNLSFTTPEFNRQPGCCGETENNDDYVSFYVTLHPDVAMFELVVAPGYADPPGAGTYNIVSGDMITPGSCGIDIPGGSPVCITGSGPHKITYLKPGNNKIKYIFRQIPKPIYPLDQPTRVGCTLPLPIYGLNGIIINAIAKSPNLTASLATANTFMSCLNCENPIFEPGANATYPYTITYQVSGTPKAAACGSYSTSGNFTVTVYDALNVSVSPDPGTFCAGGPGVELTATATGGDMNYSYSWINSSGVPGPLTSTYTAPEEEIYTVQVSDGLVSATCPTASYTVSVIEANTPIVNAGPDLTACESSPTLVLNGSVQFANALWVGGNGTFSPSRSSAVATYTPTAEEIASESVTLTLTSTNAGGGCLESSDDVTILYSTSMTIDETIGSIVCNGQTTSISTTVNDGRPNYSYQWTTGATTDEITVSAGTYSLTVTDHYSCTVTKNFTVNQPSPINLTTSSTDETAGGDGSVSISISGGDAPYSVVWTDALNNVISSTTLTIPPFNNTVSPLGYGYYTATVTDANGCEVASSVVVNSFACSGLGINISASDVDCYGSSTGSVSAAGFGGVSIPSESYSYSWSSGQATAVVNGLPAGVYTVTVTDNNNPTCTDVASIALFQPTALTNTITQTDVTVQGGNDGTATANPLGGTPIYTYEWNTTPLQISQTATGLMAGTYSVEITDSEGCTLSDNVLINEPPCNDFLLAVNTTNVSCNGGNSGSASLFITNGTPPFSIAWSTGQTVVSSISNLLAGSYSVDVTDVNGCVTTKNFTITEPDAISVGLDATNSSCFGSNNGTIDLTVSGGTYPQYYYSWATAGKVIANHQDLIMLPPGTYTVTVTDENGCSAIASVGITQPSKIEGNYTYTDNLCYGQSVGSVNATITGGTLPYMYDWEGPSSFSASTEDINGLATGLYELNLTDGNNCAFGPLLVYISQPELLSANSVMTQQVSCNGSADGAANLTVLGGTSPYSFAWTGPLGFSYAGEDLTNVVAGTYNVSISDDHGCTTSTSVIITTVPDVTAPVITCVGNQTVNTSSLSCVYTHTGTAWNATATDNCLVASVTYVLTGATTGTGTSLNNVAFNLGETTVTWTATDGLNNTDVCSHTVTVTDVTLPSLTNCIADQSVSSNTGVCTYTVVGTAWNAAATDNCTAITLTANVTGATTANGLTTLSGFVFNFGTSTVTWIATDGSNNSVTCEFDVTVIDDQDPEITACIGSIQTVDANAGECTYTVTSSAWDAVSDDNCTVSSVLVDLSGATTANDLTTLNNVVFNLGTTLVTWTVTDQSGNTDVCTFNVLVEDNEVPVISNCPSDISINNDNGDCGALATWTLPSYSDNCGAVMTFSHLPNTYFEVGSTTVTYTVTDGSGNVSLCSFEVTVDDNENPVLSCPATIETCDPYVEFSYPTALDNCEALTVLQTAGLTSGLNYPIGTTVNAYSVTDIHGNTSTCNFSVVVFPVPVISFDVTQVSCNGLGDGQIDATISVGTAPYTYSWTNGADTEDLTNLIPGTYSLTVVDDNGCTDNSATMISQPATLTLLATDDHVNCFNGADGGIDLTISGGTTPYTYNWSDGTSSQDLISIEEGAYDVLVTDNNGCEVNYSTTISQPDSLMITGTPYPANCGSATGLITVNVTGGTTPYNFDWSDGSTGMSIYNVEPGIYTLDVTDAQGCTNSFTDTIKSISDLSATLSVKDVRCFGYKDGEISTSISSGYAPYTYEWSDGQSNGIASELLAGNYSVTITDFYGCEVTLTADVNEPDSLYIILSNSLYSGGNNISQYGGDDGYINSNVYGGVSPYDYSWFGPDNFTSEQQNIINLEQGAYLLTVTDANSCQVSISSRLTQPDILEMPNGFSPNGDKDNEYFVVHGIDAYPDNTIQVFNRWGNLVYEMEGYKNEWNGDNMNGEPLPDGTYFVVLIVRINGEDLDPLTGYVDLRR